MLVGAIMASARKRPSTDSTERFGAEEALRRFFELDSDAEGMSSGEESELDRQLYDMDQELR